MGYDSGGMAIHEALGAKDRMVEVTPTRRASAAEVFRRVAAKVKTTLTDTPRLNAFRANMTHWEDMTPAQRRGVQIGVAVSGVFALAGCAVDLPSGADPSGTAPTGGEGSTPPATDPRPGYTGPSDECWTIYDAALHEGSVPEANAQKLVDCGYENPGYFEYHRMPVISSETGEVLGSVSFGDRPPH